MQLRPQRLLESASRWETVHSSAARPAGAVNLTAPPRVCLDVKHLDTSQAL